MTEVSVAELVRRIDGLERRWSDYETKHVLDAVYTRDMNEIRNDVVEIKDNQRWATRLIIVQLIGAAVAILVWVLNSAAG